MYNTTYLAQANILKGVASFANSPALQNVIKVNNRVASMIKPFIEMQQQMKVIYKPIGDMASMYSATQAMLSRFAVYNVANSQVAEILNKCNSIREMYPMNFAHNKELLQIINNASALKGYITHLKSMSVAIGMVEKYQNLYDTLVAVPDTFYDEILIDTEYEKEDVLEGIEKFTELIDTLEEDVETGESIDEVKDRKIKEFYEKHPVCFILIQIISILLTVAGAISTCEDVYLPMVQEVIIRSEGNEDIYFTKANIARVYELPDCHSKQVGKLFYGDKMKKVEDTNMWIKVEFTDKDGNDFTGWVAKRNLIDYQTWKYNSDSLYTMGD